MVEIGVPPAGADEWEAFLSIDGGRSFPVRITPHLRIAERSFAWTVPSLPTPSARIRLRFGVGGVEMERETPNRFAVAFSQRAAPLSGSGTALRSSPAPGEEETLAWVERRGSRTVLAVADPVRGIASESRWSAAVRPWRGIPRRRPAPIPAALVPGAVPSVAPGIPIRPAPRGRSLASVSRLNV
jgi:hypothetical protein